MINLYSKSILMNSDLISSNSNFIILPSSLFDYDGCRYYDGAYSTNGVDWEKFTAPTFQNWVQIAKSDKIFVVMSFGYSLLGTSTPTNIFMYSEDGKNWTAGTLPISLNIKGVAYGNGMFVAAGFTDNADTKKYVYSTDGKNWIAGTLPVAKNVEFVTYGNGKFILGNYKQSNTIYYSTDGINWKTTTLPASCYTNSACWGGDRFVMHTGNGIMCSTDGINWTLTGPAAVGKNIVYANNEFVAVKRGETSYSLDGATWNTVTNNLPKADIGISVVYSNGLYLLYTSDDNMNILFFLSKDGINWEEITIPVEVSMGVALFGY